MKKTLKRVAIGLAIILVVGGAAFFITKSYFPDSYAGGIIAEVMDNPTPDEQAVIDTDFNADVKPTDVQVGTEIGVYSTIHQMANTKIIAIDGERWGLMPITKVGVERVQKAVKDLNIHDETIDGILDRWSKQDFSQIVEDHNIIWAGYLYGNVGKAIKPRK